MITCPNCNKEIADGSKFCNHCGKPIETLIACTNKACSDYSKKILPADSKYCPTCGQKIVFAKKSKPHQCKDRVKQSQIRQNNSENRILSTQIPIDKEIDSLPYVDLGLSICWAKCNLCAHSPEQLGIESGWADPTGECKDGDNECISKPGFFRNGGEWISNSYGGPNPPQNIIGSQLDIARVKLGTDWCLPSKEQFCELISCENHIVTVKGQKCIKFIGPNGNALLLPIKKEDYDDGYWTGISSGYIWAYRMYGSIGYSTNKFELAVDTGLRYAHLLIRPVYVGKSFANKKNNHSLSQSNAQYVDLGLSVKWATCNLGASKPEDPGQFHKWGDPYDKNKDKGYTDFYNFFDRWKSDELGGKKPPKSIVGSTLDIVRTQKGSHWRLPTEKEMQELIDKCVCRFCFRNGVKGYEFKAKNGNSIFLPHVGYEDASSINYIYYWTGISNESNACALYICLHSGELRYMVSKDVSRHLGCLVRPVYE